MSEVTSQTNETAAATAAYPQSEAPANPWRDVPPLVGPEKTNDRIATLPLGAGNSADLWRQNGYKLPEYDITATIGIRFDAPTLTVARRDAIGLLLAAMEAAVEELRRIHANGREA